MRQNRAMEVSLTRPGTGAARAFVERHARTPASFVPHPGPPGTGPDGPAPPGFDLDRRRVRLGAGEAGFAAACDAVRRWRPFDLGWVELVPADSSLAVGTVVATRIRACGLWWLNPCRVVAVEDETAADGVAGRRFGFTYATLEGHVERGEERFRVELDRGGGVWYELAAVSRPAHWLTRIGYPWVRRLQRRFAVDSLAVMARAVAPSEGHGG
jgi:uncharacterized protein (UPF0548 family)